MRVDLLSLFPNMFASVLDSSILARAQKSELLDVRCVDVRDFSEDKHNSVDDTPYGGGAGMVMRVDPVVRAIEAVIGDEGGCADGRLIVHMSAAGQSLRQKTARHLASFRHLVLIAGHYEGIDDRIADYVDLELSIGDYILTGGELAALVVVDAVARLLPGVLGNSDSIEEESYESHRLEHPQYTRPLVFAGAEIPDVLRSGHHQKIAEWRREQSLIRTQERRPDLLRRHPLTSEEIEALCGREPKRRRRR